MIVSWLLNHINIHWELNLRKHCFYPNQLHRYKFWAGCNYHSLVLIAFLELIHQGLNHMNKYRTYRIDHQAKPLYCRKWKGLFDYGLSSRYESLLLMAIHIDKYHN